MEYCSWNKYLYFGRQIRKVVLSFPKTFQINYFPPVVVNEINNFLSLVPNSQRKWIYPVVTASPSIYLSSHNFIESKRLMLHKNNDCPPKYFKSNLLERAVCQLILFSGYPSRVRLRPGAVQKNKYATGGKKFDPERFLTCRVNVIHAQCSLTKFFL